MERDWVSAVARVLSEPALLDLFERSPDDAARECRVREKDRAAFVALSPEGLRRQAETLVDKRIHEALRWLPRTVERLGDRAAPLFREFAREFWPEGFERHAKDAVAFAAWLERRGEDVSRAERKMLAFRLSGRRWAVRVARDFPSRAGERPALVVLWWWRGGLRHLAWVLRW